MSVDARALVASASWSGHNGIRKPGFFMRVVHARPHMIKRPVAAGSVVHGPEHYEMAVTIHAVAEFNAAGRTVAIRVDPMMPSDAALPTVLLAPPANISADNWASLVTEWKPDVKVCSRA